MIVSVLRRLLANRLVTLLLRGVWMLYAVALFISTHIHIPDDLDLLEDNRDKYVHAAAYFGLTLLTAAANAQWLRNRNGNLAWMFCGLVGFATLDELLQGPVGRSPELLDWLCDCGGIIVAGLFVSQILSSDQQSTQIDSTPSA